MEALSGWWNAIVTNGTKSAIITSARVAAPPHVGGLLKRPDRAACFCAFLRSSGLGGRLVRPRCSTIPAALPRCFVRRLRFVWAIGDPQGSPSGQAARTNRPSWSTFVASTVRLAPGTKQYGGVGGPIFAPTAL